MREWDSRWSECSGGERRKSGGWAALQILLRQGAAVLRPDKNKRERDRTRQWIVRVKRDDGAVAKRSGFDGRQGHVRDVLAGGDGEEKRQGLFGLGFAAWIGEHKMQRRVMNAGIGGPISTQGLHFVHVR
jgi:hypothetical protein